MQLSINFYIAALAGKAFHFDGKTTWTALTSGTANNFYCCWGFSPTDVWFAGAGGFLYHYTGGSPFTAYVSPVAAFYDVIGMWGNSSSSIWAVCQRNVGFGDISKILYWNGTDWSELVSYNVRLGGAIWGIGSLIYIGRWTVFGAEGIVSLSGISLTADSSGIDDAISGIGYDGTNWWITDAGDGPVGVGGDFAWKGSLNSWTVSDVSVSAQQRANYDIGNHCWADPDSGQVFTCFYNGGGIPNITGIRRYVPGSGWTTVAMGYRFHHIMGTDRDSVLAVGGQGEYAFWDGNIWTQTQQPDIIADMRGIWGAGEPLSDVATTNDNAIVVLDGPVRESGERGEIVTPTVDAYRPG